MSQNLPTLYENIMSGLPSEFAQDAFLWASDQFEADPMLYKAEAFAREADSLAANVDALIRPAQLSDDKRRDLLGFFIARHANYRLHGNKTPQHAVNK